MHFWFTEQLLLVIELQVTQFTKARESNVCLLLPYQPKFFFQQIKVIKIGPNY